LDISADYYTMLSHRFTASIGPQGDIVGAQLRNYTLVKAKEMLGALGSMDRSFRLFDAHRRTNWKVVDRTTIDCPCLWHWNLFCTNLAMEFSNEVQV
jgi:hypothetical protein